MKFISKINLLGLLAIAFACNNAPDDALEATEAQEVNNPDEITATYAVDTEGDEIHWEGFKTYQDGKHVGTIQVQTGEILVENGEVVGGNFVIDMNSIANEDLPEEGDYNKAKLEGHLKSEDFFYASEYPTAKFTITNVKKNDGTANAQNAPADKENNTAATNDAEYLISGNLMMRGKEKNITIPANIDVNEDEVTVETPQFTIDRTQWDVMFLSKNLESVVKENAVDNNIRLKIDLKAKKA